MWPHHAAGHTLEAVDQDKAALRRVLDKEMNTLMLATEWCQLSLKDKTDPGEGRSGAQVLSIQASGASASKLFPQFTRARLGGKESSLDVLSNVLCPHVLQGCERGAAFGRHSLS